MQKTVVVSTEELENIILDCVDRCLSVFKKELIPTRMESDIISAKEAAEYIKISIPTLYKFTAAGDLPFIKRHGKLLFSKKELTAWLMEGSSKQPTTLKQIEKSAAVA